MVYINLAASEPWWIRFFGRLHWLMSRGMESESVRRFDKCDAHIHIYVAPSAWMGVRQIEGLGRVVADYLVDCGYEPRDVSGDLVDGPFVSRAFGPNPS